MKKIIYLSGAISNDKNYLKKFEKHANILLEKYPDSEIFNTAIYGTECFERGLIETSKGEKRMWSDFMLQDLFKMSECTHIYFIPEETKSSGRDIEKIWAERIGVQIIEPIVYNEENNI